MAVRFRFKVIEKVTTESVWNKDEKTPNVKVVFNASQQEPFGSATPAVAFSATMIKSAADQFVVGEEYDFLATRTP